MFDLMHLAYQGNLTRVTSFMMARELSTLSYPQIGVADGHHPVSHNNNIPEQVAKKIKVDIYHLDLRAVPRQAPGDARRGRQSARSLAVPVWQRHDQRQPARSREPADAARGGGAGKHQGNRHLKMAKSTPLRT